VSKHPLYNTIGLQKYNKSHVLDALVNKQMEFKQLEDEYQSKIAKIKTDLSALEHTICLFDNDCSETIAKITQKSANKRVVTRNRYFDKGKIKKLILTTLRTVNKPLKTSDIALSCQKIENISTANKETNKTISKNIMKTLRELEKSNIVEMIGKDDLSFLWRDRFPFWVVFKILCQHRVIPKIVS